MKIFVKIFFDNKIIFIDDDYKRNLWKDSSMGVLEVSSDFISDDYKENLWKDSSRNLRKVYLKFPATLLTALVMIIKEIFGKFLPWFY